MANVDEAAPGRELLQSAPLVKEADLPLLSLLLGIDGGGDRRVRLGRGSRHACGRTGTRPHAGRTAWSVPAHGQVGDLMGVLHAQVSRSGQVLAARAGAFREHVLSRVRMIVPRQVRARRAGLLARLALPAATATRPGLRRLLPRLVIGTGRHRRVPAVPGNQPLQPRDLRRLLRQLRLQLRVLRPQPPVRILQRGDHAGHIRRIGHTRTTPELALSKQHDTPSRPTATLPDRTSQPGMAGT